MVVYQARTSLKQKKKKHSNLTWLASDINFKLLHTGCPIAHGVISFNTRFRNHSFIKATALFKRMNCAAGMICFTPFWFEHVHYTFRYDLDF